MNRVRSGRFASTPCGVIRQPGQFTFRTGSGPAWQRALRTAAALGVDPTAGALYFRPTWNSMARRVVARIGNHIFYR